MKKTVYTAPSTQLIRVKNQTILAGSNNYDGNTDTIDVNEGNMGGPTDQGSAHSAPDYNLWND